MTPGIWLVLGLLAFAYVVILVTVAAEDVESHVRRALDTEADDWDEPSRADVEAMSDTPIYAATVAHIAKHAAATVDDEWAAINDATGGAA